MALKVLQDTRHIRVGLNPNFLRMQERPPILRREDRVNNQVGRDWGIEYDNNISIRSNQCDSDALSGRFPCACRSQGRSPGLFSVRPSGDWSRPEKMSKLHARAGTPALNGRGRPFYITPTPTRRHALHPTFPCGQLLPLQWPAKEKPLPKRQGRRPDRDLPQG